MKLVFSSTWASIPRYKVDFYEQAVVGAYEAAATTFGTGSKTEKRYHAVPTKEILAKARSLNFKMGPNRLRKTFLEPLEEAGLLSSEQDPDDKRGLAWTPIQLAQKNGRLGERRSFEPESVRRALKQVSDGLGDLVPNYSYPDGLLVSDLGEFTVYLIGGTRTDENETVTQGQAPPGAKLITEPEQVSVSSQSEPALPSDNSAVPTEPAAHLKYPTCSEPGCGKVLGQGDELSVYTLGKQHFCRGHYLSRTKEAKEARDQA
jgi:hypothetical protein